ncbi:MAG: hypothetical protein CMH62_00985 [Nanoarchaeota archaeon]|nr:hypothetical protein [Nanoarchaeota archaeon]|tara:strand:- start:438 stop:923 length:486 start_codon:yes stop_codon:yes gene_type:complete
MKIDLMKYIPNKIIPKQGNLKEFSISEHNSNLLLFYKGCRKKILLPRFVNLSEEDFVAIGLYLAEGQKYVNLDKKYHHSGEIDFSNSELISLELFCKFIKKLNISSKEFRWEIVLNVKRKFIDKSLLLNYWVENLNLDFEKRRPKSVRYSGSLFTNPKTVS